VFERNLQRFVVGSALAICATALYPVVKNTLRPIVHDLTKQMKYLIVTTKEGLEDMAAEVKFERVRKSLDNDIFISGNVYETDSESQIYH
jgi:hypothetical protein